MFRPDEWRSLYFAEFVRKEGIAIALAQYLLDRDVAYELVPHPHSETALASDAARGQPADRNVSTTLRQQVV